MKVAETQNEVGSIHLRLGQYGAARAAFEFQRQTADRLDALSIGGGKYNNFLKQALEGLAVTAALDARGDERPLPEEVLGYMVKVLAIDGVDIIGEVPKKEVEIWLERNIRSLLSDE